MNDSDFLLEKADIYLDLGQYLHAVQIFTSLLSYPKYRRIAIIRLVEIYENQNQVDSAVNIFEKYLNDVNEDDDLRTYYAHFLIRHEKYSEANNVLSVISKETHPEKNYLIGMVNYNLSDYEIAQINFQDFIKTNSQSDLIPEAYLYLAKVHLKQYHLDSALKHAKQSEKLYGGNYEVHLILAIIYYLKEMYFHANEKIEKSISLNPMEAVLYEWFGKILYKMGEFEKAEKQFLDYLSLAEPDSEIYSLIGMTLLNRSKTAEAANYFDMALQLNPENDLARRGINDCKSSER